MIKGGLARNGMTYKDYLKVSGMSQTKYYSHLRNPENITVGELRILRKLKVLSDEDLLSIL